ncbi:unnamed protein product [Protopolystoma xenopodis]|uniref:PH domain-containing protein n=1 Tax=Protopolystoma xenopodis TaxID=117903 RepID=A0A448WLG5_9PLAT|nr:unnamed protein product [Protopolystoma xenopodis]
MFAADDDQERQQWVQSIYRATGQTYKPIPPAKSTPPTAAPNGAAGSQSGGGPVGGPYGKGRTQNGKR